MRCGKIFKTEYCCFIALLLVTFYRERTDDQRKTVMELHEFDPTGNYRSTLRIPAGEIYFHPFKEYDMDKEGNIYNLIPGKDALRIHIFISGSL